MVAKGQDRPTADRASVMARAAQWRRRDSPWRPMTRFLQPQQMGRLPETRVQGMQRVMQPSFRWTDQPMSSFRQIKANRRNALRSSDPNTEGRQMPVAANAVRRLTSALISSLTREFRCRPTGSVTIVIAPDIFPIRTHPEKPPGDRIPLGGFLVFKALRHVRRYRSSRGTRGRTAIDR
jgi:hypothetical protein